MTEGNVMHGTCLCGEVRYTVEGPLGFLAHCHCSMCRKHHGAIYATYTGVPRAQFKWVAGESQVQSYASSAQATRAFCKTCGAVAPVEIPGMDMVVLPAGNLVDPLGMRPQFHMFAGSKAPWHTITDDLPQYEAYPPEYPGSGLETPARATREGVISGSCLCDTVGYEITSQPLKMFKCYCSRCRRGRSAAHATNVFYKLDDFRYTRGEEALGDYRVSDARYFGVAFCRSCGSSVPRRSPERGIVSVPAGSLDTHPGMETLGHIFTASKADWVEITDSCPQFEAAPPA